MVCRKSAFSIYIQIKGMAKNLQNIEKIRRKLWPPDFSNLRRPAKSTLVCGVRRCLSLRKRTIYQYHKGWTVVKNSIVKYCTGRTDLQVLPPSQRQNVRNNLRNVNSYFLQKPYSSMKYPLIVWFALSAQLLFSQETTLSAAYKKETIEKLSLLIQDFYISILKLRSKRVNIFINNTKRDILLSAMTTKHLLPSSQR